MEENNLLDENAWVEERLAIRVPKLVMIEKACLIGYSIFLLRSLWMNLSKELWISVLLNFYFLSDILILVTLYWWQRNSIAYDENYSIQRLKRPIPLTLFRGILSLIIISTVYQKFVFFSYFVSGSITLDSFSLFDYIWMVGMQLLDLGLAFLLANYLFITNKIQKAIL